MRIIQGFRSVSIVFVCFVLFGWPLATAALSNDNERAVDVVVCLDTSGSMEQLLDSARARVWDVVNELSRLTPTPRLRVGLISFGSEESSEDRGWIVEHTNLTGDLDRVYGLLMAMTARGGEEYVGQALDAAVSNMSWSGDSNALRIVFIAGNESADQGPEIYGFREVALEARRQGIIVNALYAGNREQGVVELWPELARAGGGNFSAIDPVTGTLQLTTPQDEQLLELNELLNGTYIPYGNDGIDGMTNQVTQDKNASRLGVQSCSSRIAAKGTALYSNASWDLVDAVNTVDFSWSELDVTTLPVELQAMGNIELTEHVEATRAERERLQEQIQLLSLEREQFIREAIKGSSFDSPGLGAAMRQTVREQALSAGFSGGGC